MSISLPVLKREIVAILEENSHNLGGLTSKTVRQQVEMRLGLSDGALSSHRAEVTMLISEHINRDGAAEQQHADTGGGGSVKAETNVNYTQPTSHSPHLSSSSSSSNTLSFSQPIHRASNNFSSGSMAHDINKRKLPTTKKEDTSYDQSPDAQDDDLSLSSQSKRMKHDPSQDKNPHCVELGKSRKASVSLFKGMTLINIREYYMDKDGSEKPGKKGISLTVPQWRSLVEGIDKINWSIEHPPKE